VSGNYRLRYRYRPTFRPIPIPKCRFQPFSELSVSAEISARLGTKISAGKNCLNWLKRDWNWQKRKKWNYLYNKRACPTKKEPQQGFLYLTIKMSSPEKFNSNAKTSTSTGILFLFYYFLIKSYFKELLRM
jgi:hypothetical protein